MFVADMSSVPRLLCFLLNRGGCRDGDSSGGDLRGPPIPCWRPGGARLLYFLLNVLRGQTVGHISLNLVSILFAHLSPCSARGEVDSVFVLLTSIIDFPSALP